MQSIMLVWNRRKQVHVWVGLVLALSVPGLTGAQKLTPGEVVTKHLESIGPGAARAAVKSRTSQGEGQVTVVVGGKGNMAGPVEFISEGRKVSYRLALEFQEYRGERLLFDGQTTEVATLRDVKGSRLERFVYQFNEIMGEGLFGGTLSTGWALLDVTGREPKLEYQGIKKIDGVEVHQLQYRARKGSTELKVWIYLDSQTFRHVKTVYQLIIPPPVVTRPEESSRQVETRYKLAESFSDFRTVDGLSLPYHWNIRLTTESRDTSIWEWDMLFSRIAENQPIDPKIFQLLFTRREPQPGLSMGAEAGVF